MVYTFKTCYHSYIYLHAYTMYNSVIHLEFIISISSLVHLNSRENQNVDQDDLWFLHGGCVQRGLLLCAPEWQDQDKGKLLLL